MEERKETIILIYKCDISGEQFTKEESILDDPPSESVRCEIHNEDRHYAILVGIESSSEDIKPNKMERQ